MFTLCVFIRRKVCYMIAFSLPEKKTHSVKEPLNVVHMVLLWTEIFY